MKIQNLLRFGTIGILTLVLSGLVVKADQLVIYSFTGQAGANGQFVTNAIPTAFDNTLLSSASALGTNSTPGAFIGLTYRISGTLVNNGSAAAAYPLIDARLTSAAPDPSLYFQFALTAAQDLYLTNLSYDLATGSSSATTIRGADVQYSLDGFTSSFVDLGTNGVTGNADAFTHFSIDLGNATFLSGQTVTFRFDPFVNTGAAGGVRFDNIEIDGILIPVPEPSTMALAGLSGLGALLLRRRKS